MLADGPPRLAIRYSTLAIWVTLAVVVAVLLFFFQKTKLGLGYRAVAANRESSQLVGVPVGRMLMLGWAISAVLGTIAAIMVSQSHQHPRLQPHVGGAALRLRGRGPRRVRQHPGRGGRRSDRRAWPRPSSRRSSASSGSELSLAVALGVIVVVLLVRPEGLFGSKRVERV